jgi:DNA-binding CsgD family transcriptional regulator
MATNEPAETMLGREQELAAVGRFLDAAAASPAALLIEGDAGIGKTTIWLEGVRAAATREHLVLSSRASPAETRLSYTALGDLLDPVIDQALPQLPGPQQRALAFATLRWEPAGQAPDQRTVSVAFLTVLRLLAEHCPVLVAIDDLQWMDPPSARVLRFAQRRLTVEPVGVLAAVRLGVPHDNPLQVGDPAGGGRLERLRLGPLSVGAIDQLIRTRAAMDAPRPVLLRLYETSRGNPLFALELAQALSARHEPPVVGAPLPVPHDLRELLIGQLRRLPASVRELLLLTALAAKPTHATLERALGQQAQPLLERAIEARLLEREGDLLRFTHPLLAAAISESTPAHRRRCAHQQLADMATDTEERALHLAMAATGPDPRVADLLEQAALRARSRGASDASADLYEQAAALTPDPQEGLRRRVRAAECRFQSGEVARAEHLLEAAIAALPAGALRAEALWQHALIRVHGDNVMTAVGLLEQALEESQDRSRLRGSIQIALAMSVLWTGDVPACSAYARAAVQALEGIGEADLLAAALAIQAFSEFLTGQDVPSAMLDRAEGLETAAEHLPVEWRPSFLGGYILKTTGELEAARSRFDRLHTRLREQGEEASMPFLLFQMSELEAWAGNLGPAAGYAEEAVQTARRNRQPVLEAAALYTKGLADAYAGGLNDARSAGERALAMALPSGIAPVIQFAASLLGFVELTAGNPAATDHQLRPIAKLLVAAGLGEPDIFRFLPDEIEALIELGDLDEAARFLEPFEERAQALGRRWSASAAARCRGLLAAARGDLAGALACMQQAMRACDGLPLPLELGRTLLAKGRVERRAKRWRDARASLAEAVRIFEQLGCEPWAQKARDELARIGGRPSGPRGLTQTEQRVAELIASGRTTRQVADALFLTPRAVEANLAKIYRKLGISSRAQLGARVSRLDSSST